LSETIVDKSEVGTAGARGRVLAWWRSRTGRQLLQELALMLGLFVFYKAVRLLARGQVGEALRHAGAVIRLERHLGIFTEPSLQTVALHSRLALRFLNTYYVTLHFGVMIVALIVLYVRHAEGYARTRRLLLAMTSIALVMYVAYPLAPPRMFPQLGFVDTGRLVGPGAYAHGGVFNGVANQFAAMPSMHFGWAVLVAWAVITYSRARARYLIVLHPVVTLLAIVLTANHYWLDAAVAAGLFLAALRFDEWRLNRARRASDERAPVSVSSRAFPGPPTRT
jgi:hypothetical protein